MQLFVTGSTGLLGTALLAESLRRGHGVTAPSSHDFDVTDVGVVARFASGEFGSADWCVNLAAYTNVDGAETHVQQATELNTLAPGYLSQACLALGVRMLHVSTDYVFGGMAQESFGEDDPVSPVQTYGTTKAEGERSVLDTNPSSIVARVAWLFGPSRPCFPSWLISKFQQNEPVRLVADQVGTPSSTKDVSAMLLSLMEAGAEPGIYHVAGTQAVSRFDYGRAVATAYERATGHRATDLTPVPASEFPTPAKRPANSALRTEKVLAYAPAHQPLPDALDELIRAE